MKHFSTLYWALILAICITAGTLPVAQAAIFDTIGTGSSTNSKSDEFFDIDSNGDYAYVAGRYHGLRIFDIRDRSNPKDVTPADDVYGGACRIDAESAVLVSGDDLYVAFLEASPNGTAAKGVRQYSLATPEAPEFICTYTDIKQVMGIAVRNMHGNSSVAAFPFTPPSRLKMAP